MGSIRSAGLSFLLLSFGLYIADSYANTDPQNVGCDGCTLRKHILFPDTYQCMGCCYSRAYPTSPHSMRTMSIPKTITSESTCCVAKHSVETVVSGITVNNHTDCHCGTCFFHKI